MTCSNKFPAATSVLTAVWLALSAMSPGLAADAEPERVKNIVDTAILPLMKKYRIPGTAVGISWKGQKFVINNGVASRTTTNPITDDSFFEVGSVSKTFTATLACLAQIDGKLSFSDKTSKYLPNLAGTSFGNLTLLNLATHTSGGLPLQLPENVTSDAKLMDYLKAWKPKLKPGTVRNYANPGIGMLGYITAKCRKQNYDQLMEDEIFVPLGMKHSHTKVPELEISNYVQGYNDADNPVRMKAAVLGSEAYGVRATASDLIRFINCNLGSGTADEKLQRAILSTHTGYFQAHAMTQDLIWEQYPLPVTEKDLLDGSSHSMVYESTPVTQITPPEQPRSDVWIHKTGSTAGFAAYVAFIPREKAGIVILANKSCPISDRILAARKILKELGANF